MRIIRFTSAVSCGILRPSQRAFGTYLCVYREEDDHTAPDRKSSGWMILSAMWLRRTMFPSRRVGRGRQILSFPSSCRPGQKVRRCEWSRSDALFVCTLLYILLSAGDIHFHRISPSHIHPCMYTAPSPHPVVFSTYFLTRRRCFHRFFLRRSADPPGSPPSILPTAPLFFRQLCSVPRPAILTVALVPLYLQLPSSRYTYSRPLPVPSQVCMQLPKTSLLSALFAFCIVSPMACLCPWIQIVYNV